MWTLIPSEQHKQPLYQQIIHLIEQLIENGQLQAGERLPSERKLSELLRVNRSTIIHALELLTERGIIIRKLGSGSYVNNEKWGLQSYPIINWQNTSHHLIKPKDHYALKVSQLRKLAHNQQAPLLDLANGDLPSDLLPNLSLPEYSLHELLKQEQTAEASHLGLNSFRTAIRQYLQQKFDMEVDQDQILITSGTQQAIFLITQGLLRPGDAIGIEAPSYFYSLPLFQAAGLRIYAISTDEQGITLDGLDKLHQTHPLKMIFLNPIFQNPTGALMSTPRKKQLLKYCYNKRIPIIEDDAYSALNFSPSNDTTPIKKYDKYQQVIYVGSFSKYIGKNIRAGWMIAPKAIINKLADIRSQLDSGLSVLPQLLTQHYLNEHSHRHQSLLQNNLSSKSQQLITWLNQHYPQRLHFQPPKGGFHLYARVIEQHTSALDTVLQELLGQHIIVTKGIEFGDSPNYLRFSYGHFNDKPIKKMI